MESMKRSFLIGVAVMVCATMSFAKAYMSDNFYFNYPENFLLTESEQGKWGKIVLMHPEKQAIVIYLFLSDSSFLKANEQNLEPLFEQIGRQKALEYTQSAQLSNVHLGVSQTIRFPHFHGLLSSLEMENNEGVKFTGSVIMSVKDINLLIIMSLTSNRDYDPVIYKVLRSTRFGTGAPNEQSVADSQSMHVDPFDVKDSIYIVAEKMPDFPGGQTELFKYLSQTVQYPKDCQRYGIQGRVVCSFVVTKNGKIEEVEVLKSGGHPLFDREAVRVIRSMPKWEPGTERGEPVRVRYTLPISFKLR